MDLCHPTTIEELFGNDMKMENVSNPIVTTGVSVESLQQCIVALNRELEG